MRGAPQRSSAAHGSLNTTTDTMGDHRRSGQWLLSLLAIPVAFCPPAESRVPQCREQEPQRHDDVVPVAMFVELARRESGGHVTQPADCLPLLASQFLQIEQEPDILREEQTL